MNLAGRVQNGTGRKRDGFKAGRVESETGSKRDGSKAGRSKAGWATGELLALDCLGWDSEGLYLLVGDCNSLSNARLLTPHSLLFQVTSSELVEVAGG
ncbi:hypothetical protein DY000_02053910 [Brassica cretica]|uniref:Uncharacterized protein n=1 Tax=Brassica cretica TaxID=69181 RepID=A0ABQ7AI32_BRACR|nr:hypothetical protein DY000_02053910 [Brassica cretica]